jgi:PAS domain S-box-containing protein
MAWGERAETSELFADLIRSAAVVALRLDHAGVVIDADGRGIADCGKRAEDLLGRAFVELFPDPPVVESIVGALAGRPSSSVVSAWGRHWDAQHAPVRIGSEIVGAITLWMDCTERERALREAQRELRFVDSVLDNVPNMIFVKDARELRFLRFNRAGEELLGLSRDQMLGKTDRDIFPRPEADFFTAKDRTVLASGRMLDIPEEHVETRAKGRRYLRTKKIPILDERGEPLYLVGISEDITEWHALDDERRKVLDRLLDLDHLKAQLIANVSHELRTPLTIILLITERLMRDREGPPSRLEDLAEIERSARALLALVKDLLDASKIEAGRLRAEYANIDLAELVRLTAGSLDSMARSIPVSFSIETPESVPAQVDASRIQHVVTNLLSNAFKHTPPGGSVRCVLETVGDSARISVADSGPGVPAELRARVFERFFQVPGDQQRAGGTGLGLAIVKDFTELHGGRVRVDDAPEGGALFVVELPLIAPPDANVSSIVVPLDLPMRTSLPTPPEVLEPELVPGTEQRPRVLVVEDHPDMRRLLVDALATRYRVSVAVDGRDGLERALASPPDLILTDLMMPRMTGDELVRAVRAEPTLTNVAIIVLTARDDDALRVELLRGGAQDFVSKPFSSEELVARIDNLVTIKRTRELLQHELESGRVDLEVLARDLAARGHELRDAYAEASVARRRAEASSQAKSEFLSLVSHELRSPMTTLRLRLDMLRRGPAEPIPACQAPLVERMTGAAERLYSIAQSLVDLVGVEAGGTSIHTTPIDVPTLLASVIDVFAEEAVSKGLALRTDVAPELPLLESDENLVRVILQNLVGNAVKFTDQGEVTIAAASEDGQHRIDVIDTGPGIPEPCRARIFEPFQHLEPLSHKHTRGAGVGLAIVRRAASALGGHVQLRDRPGGGSIFTVTIPTRHPPA